MATRDPWFDNVRWLAGSLVVVVHFTSSLIHNLEPGEVGTLADWLHSALYPFRLPLFALLVGYFSHVEPNTKHYNNLLRTIIFPVAIISVLHILLLLWKTGEWQFDPVAAQYTLWFMYGVVLWRVAAPYIARLRFPVSLSIIFALASGMYASLWVFGLYSVTGLTPFFVLGLMLRRNDAWLRVRTWWKTLIAVALIVAWFVGFTIFHFQGRVDRGLLGMTRSYDGDFAADNWHGMWIRFLLLLVTGLAMFASLYLAPRRHLPIITYVGAGGFTIYLLHGLVIRIINFIEPSFLAQAEAWWEILLQVAGGFALALLLGSKPVRWLVRPIVRPKANWLLLPVGKSSSSERSAFEDSQAAGSTDERPPKA